MKQRTLTYIGIIGTIFLMIGLAFSVYIYSRDPNDVMGLAAMGSLSSGLMVFLVVFAVLYTKPKPADDYMEIYRGICSRCGTEFDDNGICPKCGRVRPKRD